MLPTIRIKINPLKKTMLNFGKILFGIIKTSIKDTISKRFSAIVVYKFLIIKSLLTIFSIKCACVCTPGITSPFGILTKSNKP